jgi:uncharacterized GH25 family protein
MIHLSKRFLLAVATGFVAWCSALSCNAHFLWVKTVTENDKPHAFLFFGENVLDEAYHLPESLADTKVWYRTGKAKRSELPLKPWEGEDRIGLGAPLAGDSAYVLEASEQYGVYGTALLRYGAKHTHAATAEQLNAAGPSKDLKLDIVPRVEGEELVLTVNWNGKPLAGAEVTCAVGDAEAVAMKTDEAGRVKFKPAAGGTIGVLANHKMNDVSGKLGGTSYNQELHYSSLTLEWPVGGMDEGKAVSAKPPAVLPALPEPVSSFGAVVADGWLYVYSGHIGTEHDHSAANLSSHFRRIRLDGGRNWEELPMQTPLQGLPLVAHGGKVYRVGGLSARNTTTDEASDLHSVADFVEFDPSTGKWNSLAALPAPRSSHNAVVIGDRLYVIGGWTLAGESPGEWQSDALVYDFTNPQAGWQKLPTPPFRRRALGAGHADGKLVAIGGMDENNDVSQRVDMFDPQTGDWSEGPELPGEGMAGFGLSAWNLNGQLYASGMSGQVLRLNETATKWEKAARLQTGRFFHQLVPSPEGGLLAVGGASRDGHLADIELIDVAAQPASAEASRSDSRSRR